MSTSVNALLGVLFLALSIVTTFLMFQYWGYPYDEDARRSSCPQWKMNIHRACGFAYAGVYLLLMWQMVPRLWEYQVEFPARTVAHIIFGITIGVLLLVKVSILRWFRHFEEAMPYLGIGLLLCTFILTGLSLPPAFKERALASRGPGGSAFSQENRARVASLLLAAGLPEGTKLESLTSVASLERGREVLLGKCTYCHDLKTAIARPRTPSDWVRTVRRMAEKPTLGDVLNELEQAEVSAYLVAITPDLQDSAKAKRSMAEEQSQAIRVAKEVTGEERADAGPGLGDGGTPNTPPLPNYDPAQAKAEFDELCSQCHETSDVDENPPHTPSEVDSVLERMVENGMEAEKAQLELIREYLLRTYASK